MNAKAKTTEAERVANVEQVRIKLTRNRDGLAQALDLLKIGVRYDVRGCRTQYRLGQLDWQDANDRLEADIRERIAAAFITGKKDESLWFGRDSWKDSRNGLLYRRECDPFMLWLESLPLWDKQPRLETWLSDVFRTDDGCELTKWASMFILLGTVWRTYEPGTKLDEMPVLVGPGGCGKSTALEFLLPTAYRSDWFADGLHLASPPKERAEALQGRVIVEAAEMAGTNRADLQSLKAFLTRTNDGTHRRAYTHNPEIQLRRCVIVGTANPGENLPNDPTGLRRFVPIEVAATDDGASGVRDYLDANRNQLWAEATHLHAMGFPHPRLPDELKRKQAKATEQHRRRDDILEDRLADWLGSGRCPEYFKLQVAAAEVWPSKFHAMTNADAAAHLPIREAKRLGNALQLLGYSKRQRMLDGTRGTYWSKT
ncbi:VapE domain-containing protein [Candidatus Rariloculus sp.]|uniref:VapE domain-containing protein n=1 Tax=Candidatus Rariloculus sp. TaxID=3101265 RepID=UPI003D0BF1CA